MSDGPCRLRRFWLGEDSNPSVWLEYRDSFGRWVPLLNESGRPINFDRKPAASGRAAEALKTMDRLWGGR